MNDLAPMARFGGRVATDLRDVTTDPTALDSTGHWAVVAGFEGDVLCARFGTVRATPKARSGTASGIGTGTGSGTAAAAGRRWRGPDRSSWTSSMGEADYTAGVERIRAYIAGGEVYQVNLCRVLTAPLPDPYRADVDALTAVLALGNPAPYAGTVRLPAHGVEVATASPELYLRRSGRTVVSGPIKGTGRTAGDLLDKDHAENVMIVDLVRNDLGRVCATGSVTVPRLCEVEEHPGLVHLVSQVRGELGEGAGWAELLGATFPPGSVTGAPKSSALRIIRELETVPRGPYCGGVGWVDADRREGALAVGIRTFWIDRAAPGGPALCFGTGAGITWDSEPKREWDETELKASRLLAVASAHSRSAGHTAAGPAVERTRT